MSQLFLPQRNPWAAKDPLAYPTGPGTMDGFQVRASRPALMKQEEYEEIEIKGTYHAEVLVLPENLKRYIEIKDMIVKGQCFKDIEESHYDASKNVYHVLIGWIQALGELPRHLAGEAK